jgi:hypothetical protein
MSLGDDDRLTAAQRACLLRAARRRVAELQGEWEYIKHGLDPATVQHRYEVLAEISCLNHGITWLWRQSID